MLKSHQEHPCTWRMFLSFLILLMEIVIPGIIINELNFMPAFQKYMTHRVYIAEKPSRTSMYLEDVPELPDYPEDHCDTWNHSQ